MSTCDGTRNIRAVPRRNQRHERLTKTVVTSPLRKSWPSKPNPIYTLEGLVHGVLAGLGLNRLLIGHDELVQTVHHLIEHVRGNDTVAQQFFFPLCPRRCHLFASTNWHADIGRLLEAIDITIRYAMQQGSKAGIQ